MPTRIRLPFRRTIASLLVIAFGASPLRAEVPRAQNPSVITDQQPARRFTSELPPAPPMRSVPASIRGPLTLQPNADTTVAATSIAAALPSAVDETAILPLSSGLSMISIPLQTETNLLSDILSNLPDGSRVWTWDALEEEFVEGFDQELPPGAGAVLYLPVPAIVMVKGQRTSTMVIPVGLEPGWNLIGVPYTHSLPRSFQNVYVHLIKTPFEDAVEQNAIGAEVFTLDREQYDSVGPDDSFEPTHAYWVYSRTADMIELRPRLLQVFDPLTMWVAEEVGSMAISWGIEYLLSNINPEGNKATLEQVSGQLDEIKETQEAISRRLDGLSTQIRKSTQQILQAIGETRVGDARTFLATHFDQNNPGQSLAWFIDQAKTAEGVKSVTPEIKTKFALDVLNNWKTYDHFFDINTAILGATGSNGVLDAFGEQIVVEYSAGTLQARYEAMEAYFGTLIGMQAKCGALIMNAMEHLGTVEEYKATYPPGRAEKWRRDVYVPAIKTETERFVSVVESIAASTFILDAQPSQPEVDVPPEAQLVMARADFVAMLLRDEPAGIRVHLMVSPHIDPGYHVAWETDEVANVTEMPATDSGLWRRVAGQTEYDSWQRDPASNMAQFQITNEWLVYRSILPTNDVDNYIVRPGSNPALFDRPMTVRSALVGYNDQYGVSAAGPYFVGSAILAARPSARNMLKLCAPIRYKADGHCQATASGCDQISSGQCDTRLLPDLGWLFAERSVEFRYVGLEQRSSDFQMGVRFSDCRGTLAGLSKPAAIQLKQGATTLGKAELSIGPRTVSYAGYPPRVDSATLDVTWQPGTTYTLELSLILVLEQLVSHWVECGGVATAARDETLFNLRNFR